MISGSEVKLHVQCFSERLEKSRDELGTMVGSDMFGDAVLGEHVHYEQSNKVFGSAMNCGWNEYALLG